MLSFGQERRLETDRLKEWFDTYEKYTTEVDVNPGLIANWDETMNVISLKEGRAEVITIHGKRPVHFIPNEKTTHLTMGLVSFLPHCITCFSPVSSLQFCWADGSHSKPWMIVPGKELPRVPPEVDIDTFNWRAQAAGWMTDAIFLEVITTPVQGFVELVADRRRKLGLPADAPAILFVDGHNSHVTEDVQRILGENHVKLMVFVAHASHVQQPLDVVLFGEYKKNLKKVSI